MKTLMLLLLVSLSGCLLPSDFETMAASVHDLAVTAAKPGVTPAELDAKLAETKAEIGVVKREADARAERLTEGALTTGEAGGLASGITAIGLMLLNMWRSSTRRKDLERAVKGST